MEFAEKQYLYVRADADHRIGSGHMMRCIALAQAWRDKWNTKDGQITFISHCESQSLRQNIKDEGFQLVSIEKPYPDTEDIRITIELLSSSRKRFLASQWVVLDGYHFGTEYQREIRKNGCKLLVIDDYNHLERYHADVLLNQNLGAENIAYNFDDGTVLLRGHRYILLRSNFLKCENRVKSAPDVAKNILVTMGGGETSDLILRIINILEKFDSSILDIKIIAGHTDAKLDVIKRRIQHAQESFTLLHDVKDMASLMRWADIALTAGGSTCWELLFMGVPIVIIVLSENQKNIAAAIDATGSGINLGGYQDIRQEDIACVLSALIHEKGKRRIMASRGMGWVDGKGADRVVNAMSMDMILLRNTGKRDCELIWRWANDTEVRKNAIASDQIGWEDHLNWYNNKLSDPRCIHFIATTGQEDLLGQIRFDISNDQAEIDVSIDKDRRSKGYGARLIKAGVDSIVNRAPVRKVFSRVKMKNTPSINAFIKAGFQIEEEIKINEEKLAYLGFNLPSEDTV